MKTEFSPCRKYRYTLWRDWPGDMFDGTNDGERGNRRGEYLMVIGLNPSTADETKDDPTIRKCIGFAKRWGFGSLCMTNLFAWRDTKPENMKQAKDPEGPDNQKWLGDIASGAGVILAAWGNHGAFLDRGKRLRRDFRMFGMKLYALKLNSDGSPMHPLYCPYETVPILMP